MSNHFYVYEHWRPDTGQCFYVGKGQKFRSGRINGRNPHHANIVAKVRRAGSEIEIRVVASELSEADAFRCEVERIAHWQGLGVKLANRTGGGEGVSNPPPEVRAKIAAALTGNKHSVGMKRSEQAKAAIAARMKGNKIWEGREFTAEHRANLSKALKGKAPSRVRAVVCLDDGMAYESGAAAGRHYGIQSSTIISLCAGDKRRKTAGGLKFKYAEAA